MEQTFFSKNRANLCEQSQGALFVFTAYGLQQQHNDVAFRFRQESNFYYLSGIEEPAWLLIIDGRSGEEYLVAPDIDPIHAVFEGGLPFEVASEQSGVATILARKDLKDLLRRLAVKHDKVYTLGAHPWRHSFNFTQNSAQQQLNSILKRYFNDIEDCRPILAKQRAIKRPGEIVQIRRAIDVTGTALKRVRHMLSEAQYEYELEAEVGYTFRKAGLMHAYEPIVASGNNACTLHYQSNSARLEKGSLVLLDVGAQYMGYAADISRTYAYHQSSDRHVAVYDAVHKAHQDIIALLKSELKIKTYLSEVDQIMKNAIEGLGLIDASGEKYRDYFPHAVSHGLGLDVHESLGGYEELMEGMMLTVEPGIYIPEEGIGIRIEDNILITREGSENLSAAISTEL